MLASVVLPREVRDLTSMVDEEISPNPRPAYKSVLHEIGRKVNVLYTPYPESIAGHSKHNDNADTLKLRDLVHGCEGIPNGRVQLAWRHLSRGEHFWEISMGARVEYSPSA